MKESELVVVAASAFFLSLLCYWDEKAVNGAFVYDDAGTVKRNPCML